MRLIKLLVAVFVFTTGAQAQLAKDPVQLHGIVVSNDLSLIHI